MKHDNEVCFRLIILYYFIWTKLMAKPQEYTNRLLLLNILSCRDKDVYGLYLKELK